MRQEFLARLFFAQRAGVEGKLLEKQAIVCREWLEGFQTEISQGGSSAKVDADFAQVVYRFRVYQTQAMLDWLEECRETLK